MFQNPFDGFMQKGFETFFVTGICNATVLVLRRTLVRFVILFIFFIPCKGGK
jgi:hypothetical protein